MLGPLLTEIAGGLAAHTIAKSWTAIYGWFTAKADEEPQALRDLFDSLGWRSTQDIRDEVRDWAATLKGSQQLSKEELEEFTALLINLSRGGRTTRALIGSQPARNKLLLDDLLKQCRTARKFGEPAAPDSNWTLDRFLGKGSFGEVWRATNPGIPHKKLAFKFFASEDAKCWFANECHALNAVYAKLAAEDLVNIVQYQDVSPTSLPFPYLAFEYVPGGSLEDWILGNKETRQPLAINEVIEGVARGLSGAHAAAIQHRDLKPANVLLTEDGIPKIADFGLGNADEVAPVDQMVSRSAWTGTAMYLPPEASDHASKCDPAKQDVFAFGVLWYQLIVGRLERPPYDFAEQLRLHEADSHTINVIRKCLAHPDRRYADVTEVYQDVSDMLPVKWEVPEGCYDVSYLMREYIVNSGS